VKGSLPGFRLWGNGSIAAAPFPGKVVKDQAMALRDQVEPVSGRRVNLIGMTTTLSAADRRGFLGFSAPLFLEIESWRLFILVGCAVPPAFDKVLR
jgi:hypothetical protein